MVMPSGKQSGVKGIDSYEGELDEAFAPMSVAIRLEDEVDVSRGDMLVVPNNRPQVGRQLEADLVWLHERPIDTQKTYILKHTTQMVRVQVDSIESRLNLTTLESEKSETLGLNDIARVHLTCRRALYFDAYGNNRATGAFVLVDSLSNITVAAGMIRTKGGEQDLEDALKESRAGSGLKPKTEVSPRERRERFGQSGAAVWLTGLPGSGRWSLAYALERRLFDLGHTAHVIEPVDETLDGIVSAAHACASAGLIAICAFPSKARADRDKAKARIGAERFLEVYVDTDLALCKERRPDGDFEGFEAPTQPAVRVSFEQMRLHKAVESVIEALESAKQLDR